MLKGQRFNRILLTTLSLAFVAGGILSLFYFRRHGFSPVGTAFYVLLFFAVAQTIVDSLLFILPLTLSGATFVLGAFLFYGEGAPLMPRFLVAAVVGSLFFVLALLEIRGREALGFGDVWWGATIAFFLGSPALIPPMLLMSSLLGILLVFILSGISGAPLRETRIPFGPALSIAGVLTMIFSV